eukprot:TRINITY_DN40498_c0_g1_i1.p1 TRINITY_DN40498_c0_g1~~TRINITY_DN40498_c0_g1_i1.p1  ORF type:complete len:198 (+),score=2.95 TRINITY_DN40498_c0_g1_i1:86-595(+)
MLYFGNVSGLPIREFSVTPGVEKITALKVSLNPISAEIAVGDQTNMLVNVECVDVFEGNPTLTLSYICGEKAYRVTLQLPAITTKFITSLTLDAAKFFEQWKVIGEKPNENQRIFKASAESIKIEYISKILGGLNCSALVGIDPNVNNAVGAGTFLSNGASDLPGQIGN